MKAFKGKNQSFFFYQIEKDKGKNWLIINFFFFLLALRSDGDANNCGERVARIPKKALAFTLLRLSLDPPSTLPVAPDLLALKLFVDQKCPYTYALQHRWPRPMLITD